MLRYVAASAAAAALRLFFLILGMSFVRDDLAGPVWVMVTMVTMVTVTVMMSSDD